MTLSSRKRRLCSSASTAWAARRPCRRKSRASWVRGPPGLTSRFASRSGPPSWASRFGATARRSCWCTASRSTAPCGGISSRRCRGGSESPPTCGAGASSAAAAGDGASVTRYADDLVAILDALGVRTAAVCGLSLGGYVTFELLRRHADRVSAVLLVDTKHEPDAPATKREREELAALTERDGPEALVSRLLPKLLAPETQSEVAEQVREMARRWSVPGLVGALQALRDRPDSTETLRQIRVPTLVLAGSEDQISPPAGARAMAALIPNA